MSPSKRLFVLANDYSFFLSSHHYDKIVVCHLSPVVGKLTGIEFGRISLKRLCHGFHRTQVVEPPSKKRRLLGAHLSSSSSEDEASGNNSKQDILDEISKYRKEPKISKAGNPLHFWKKNEKRFPHLAKLARKYLCVMATSRTAERVFSSLGLLLTKRRLCLIGENVNKILFLTDKL